ncbi:MAG: DUF5723 family protein [Saprospiraceae bacterium]
MSWKIQLRFLLVLCLFNLILPDLWAQDPGLSLINASQMHTMRNIAIPFPNKNVLTIPNASAEVYNETGFTGTWLGNNGSGSRTIGLQSIWGKMERKEYLTSIDWNVQTIAFGKKFNKFQLLIAHEIEGKSDLLYNKDLIGILAYGNYGYLQQEPLAKTQALDIKPAADISVYQSIGLQAAYFLNDHHSIGFGIKYIGGWFNLNTDFTKLDVDLRDPLTIKSNEDWTLRSANLVDHLAVDSLKLNADQAGWGKHPGVGFNAGFSFHTDNLQIGIQTRDVGMIQWKGSQYSRKGSTEYSGIRINDLLNIDKGIFDHITDTLKSVFDIKESPTTYNTRLQAKIIVDGQYKLSDHWNIGGSFFYSQGSIRDYWRWMAGVVFSPADFILIGAHVSMDKNQQVDLGLLTSLKISIVHIYFGIQPIQSLINENTFDHVSGTIGLSLQWGK